MCVMSTDRELICTGLLQTLKLTQLANVLTCTFNPGKQYCRICFILIVVKDNSRFAVDIVLQLGNQNFQRRFRD